MKTQREKRERERGWEKSQTRRKIRKAKECRAAREGAVRTGPRRSPRDVAPTQARVSKISRHRRLFTGACWGFRSPQVRRPGVACVDREGSGAERTRLSIPLPPVQPPRVRAHSQENDPKGRDLENRFFPAPPAKKKNKSPSDLDQSLTASPTAKREIYTEVVL